MRKIPWRILWQPTPVFLPGESDGQRSLAGFSPWGRNESDMTERLSVHSLREGPEKGETGGLELRKQIWVLRYELDMILAEQESTMSSGIAETQEEEGRSTEVLERRMARGGTGQNHQGGRGAAKSSRLPGGVTHGTASHGSQEC